MGSRPMTGAEALIEAARVRRIAALRAEWGEVCNAMADGYWRGTEQDALDRIAEIKTELEEQP